MLNNNNEIYSLGNLNITTTYDTLKNSYFVNCVDNASPSKDNIKLFFKNIKYFQKIIKEINPEAVLFTSKHIWNFMIMLSLKINRIKIFHVFHDPIGHSGTTVSKGVVLYNKLIAKFLSGIIVHSNISLENTKKYIMPKCSIIKVPLGEKKWLNFQEKHHYKNKLLIFGRISSYKGCEFIPKLAAELLNQNINCTIIVAGKALDDVSENMISDIKKYPNIEFRNEFIPESELDAYFNSTDATLILHKSISQSGVIIDAYRHGHPILCFNIDGITEFVNEDTALIAPMFDIAVFAKNIKKLYSNFFIYQKMSYKAYKFGKEKFSPEKMENMISKFVVDALEGKK